MQEEVRQCALFALVPSTSRIYFRPTFISSQHRNNPGSYCRRGHRLSNGITTATKFGLQKVSNADESYSGLMPECYSSEVSSPPRPNSSRTLAVSPL